MTKTRKLMVVCAMALMMMVIALPSALAQSYYPSYYWDPAWLGPPATTEPAPLECDEWVEVWAFDPDTGDLDFLGWACVD